MGIPYDAWWHQILYLISFSMVGGEINAKAILIALHNSSFELKCPPSALYKLCAWECPRGSQWGSSLEKPEVSSSVDGLATPLMPDMLWLQLCRVYWCYNLA